VENKEEEYRKICVVCGDIIPSGLSLTQICPNCLIKPPKKN